MPCLDTTFLVDWLRGNESAKRKYDSLRTDEMKDQELSASIITAYELEKGAKLSKNPATDLKLVRDFVSELRILDFDQECVDLSSEIYSELSKKGKLVGEFDILIAATCIAADQSLVTNEEDFDQIANLAKIRY
jgi:tRNA(fMet)-specific endonuclease VapC